MGAGAVWPGPWALGGVAVVILTRVEGRWQGRLHSFSHDGRKTASVDPPLASDGIVGSAITEVNEKKVKV